MIFKMSLEVAYIFYFFSDLLLEEQEFISWVYLKRTSGVEETGYND